MNLQLKNIENANLLTNSIFGDFLKYNGSNQMNSDYSLSPVDFTFTADRRVLLKNVVMYLQDDLQIHYELFGSLPEITNGIRVWYKLNSSSEKVYMDAGYPIKTCGGFGKLSFDVELKEKGSGENVFTGMWDFVEYFGDYLLLEKGGSFGITINDDLSSLNEFSMFIKGKQTFFT